VARCAPGQECALAARSNRGHVAGFEAGRTVADPKYAAIGADQGAGFQPVLYLVPTNAGLEQLEPCNNAV